MSGTFPVETVDLTSGARLVGRLTQLVKSDPSAFQHVTREVANRLNDAANHAQGQEASRLRQLAETVSKAAQGEVAEQVAPDKAVTAASEAASIRSAEDLLPDPAAVEAVVKQAIAGRI